MEYFGRVAILIFKILNKTDKYDNDYPSGIWVMESWQLREILSKLN